MTTSGKLVLVNQFRFGVAKLSWEPPGGVVDDDDDDLISAGLREMEEETGYRAASARYLGWVHPNPAILTNRAHFVLAEGCQPQSGQNLDANEEIEIGEFELSEVVAMLDNGQMHHCDAHAALFALMRALGRLTP